jgi:chromosome segregation ATPase
MEKIKFRLTKALQSKYQAEMDDAIARFEIYLKNPVAIGEHPQHTEEMDKLVAQYTDAKDKIESLKEIVNEINKN